MYASQATGRQSVDEPADTVFLIASGISEANLVSNMIQHRSDVATW
jgi:hypothetical protein